MLVPELPEFELLDFTDATSKEGLTPAGVCATIGIAIMHAKQVVMRAIMHRSFRGFISRYMLLCGAKRDIQFNSMRRTIFRIGFFFLLGASVSAQQSTNFDQQLRRILEQNEF